MGRYRVPVDHEPLMRIGTPPARRRRAWYRSPWLLLAVPVAAIALLAAGAFGASLITPRLKEVTSTIDAPFAPQPFSVSGFLTLELGDFVWNKDPDVCTGHKGFDDIHAGTQVVITDSGGTTIAIGALETGVPRRDPDNPSRATQCRLPFKVAGVPGGHQFYGVAIGRRGKLEYKRDDLGRPLELTLS